MHFRERVNLEEALTSVPVVLAIDGSPTFRESLRAALESAAYRVLTADSGEALELLSLQPVDCIMLDMDSSGFDPRETCRRIKSAPGLREIPLLVLAAAAEPQHTLDMLDAGADDLIAKSTDLRIIEARVRSHIRRRQIEGETRALRAAFHRREMEARDALAATELAETRARLVEELEARNRALETFSFSVSHDLRAPLRSIRSFAQILVADYGDKLEDEARTHLGRIQAAANRMGDLIEALVQLSRIGRADFIESEVDLSHLAREAGAGVLRTWSEKPIELVVAPDVIAFGDARLLRALFDNLIDNAAKFSQRVQNPRIEFGTLRTGPVPAYFVRDNGAGFEMAHANKLFVPFQRLHADSVFQGIGIGLATVHTIVQRHGGRIWTEAAPGQGATFFFTLGAPKTRAWTPS